MKLQLVKGTSVITRSWKTASNIKATTAFSIFWNLISWSPVLLHGAGSVTVNGKAFNPETFTADPISAAVFLFPAIGFLMMYHCAALWINKTEIKLENGFLVSTRGPMPWIPKEIKIPTSDIKQAYVQEYSAYSQNNQPVIRYQLIVQRISSGDTVLENDIRVYADAQILEEWIEKNLGIQDVSVPGEVQEFKKAA